MITSNGSAVGRKNHNVIWTPQRGAQEMFLACPADEALIHGNRGGGKGLLPEEKVLTPRGWTTMGELKVGSTISNPDGSSQKVIAVYHRNFQQMYELKFSDGTKIKCDGDHLWFAKIANRIKGKTVRNYTPLDFYGSIHRTEGLYELIQKHPSKRPLIPCCDPIKYQQMFYKDGMDKIDPYLIGLILGDGAIDTKSIRVTSGDKEILDYCISKGARLFNSSGDHVSTATFYKTSDVMQWVTLLKLQGTKAKTKFIPERFMRGTVEERLAIVQGLMDTDGEANDGKAYFSSISEQLVDDLRVLIQSLGGWATKIVGKELQYRKKHWEPGKYKKTGNIGYGLYIRLPEQEELFRLLRKRTKCSNYMHGRLVRRVVSIKKLRKKCKTICIVVNNPNRLFVTKDFLVTHNSDVLIMDYLQHVGVGYGEAWRGVLFREEYTELTDIIAKCQKWVKQIFPDAKYNGSEHKWTFRTGETLYLRYMKKASDYWNYHGHEYPWIAWEELTNWPTDECYLQMISCNRCSVEGVPRKYRANCNPAGVGHGWVKQYFIDTCDPMTIHHDSDTKRTRTHIPSKLEENEALLKADPNYANTILAAVKDDPVKYKAWVKGEWDIIAGGALSDVWVPKHQVFKEVPFPSSWNVYRSFDWGSSKPWCVTYGAEANGEQFDSDYNMPYVPAGSIWIIDEIYGWDGIPNKGDFATSDMIAKRTLERDDAISKKFRCKIVAGPADTNIYEVRDGRSIAQSMAREGLHWKRAYKGAGSRVSGLSQVRQMLAASKRQDLEEPGLYFFTNARHHVRTFPLLQYDEKKPEDVDTDQEDHCYDSTRYLLTRKYLTIKHRKVGL